MSLLTKNIRVYLSIWAIYLGPLESRNFLLINVRENTWPVASHWVTISDNVVSSIPAMSWIRTHNFSNDCTCGSKSNYDHDHDGPLSCFPRDFVMLCQHTNHALFNRYTLTDVQYFGVIRNTSNYHYIHVGTPFLLLQLMVFSCSYYLNLYPTHSCWLYICNVENCKNI